MRYITTIGSRGGVISMGLSDTNCRSSKQKLNTKIYTESELVGESNYMPYKIWYIMFVNQQGYLNKPNNFSRTTKAPRGCRKTGETLAQATNAISVSGIYS